MLPTSFPQSNTELKLNDSIAIPAFKGKNLEEAGEKGIETITCWKLSKEDLEEIKNTGVIWLTVFGNANTQVLLETENPFYQDET